MMTNDTEIDPLTDAWTTRTPQVRKALAFIKRQGSITADQLVEWDPTHGRALFNWDDPGAAADWRAHQARLFLNRFRAVFEGMRVRALIHIQEDPEAGIPASAYFGIEAITQHPGMRAQVIDDITRRMKMLASELRLWKLTPEEQAVLFARLAEELREKATAA